MFEKNVRLLGDKLSPYLVEMNKVIESETQVFEVVDSKTDVPTLKVNIDGRELFLHSKYNPIQEAERLVNHMDPSVLEKDHVIFFGVGLGYHIEQFAKKYPQKTFSIVEPHAEVFLRFLENRKLEIDFINHLVSIYIQSETVTLLEYLTQLSSTMKSNTALFILPAYERLFKEKVKHFFEVYKDALKMTQSNVIATQAFSKRWVINSLLNLPTTLTTQNILEKKEYFAGKPIIIAAAGPSLYEDLEHLKYIKDKGLAYIFAVGSANKAFIANGIFPDAVLTYDPQPHNVNVFKELIASGRTDIPMIYGTSVGFETIEAYPGPLFHFVNSADTVTNFYLGKEQDEFDVQDATTISLVALQIASLLGANPIILAGQNLAFKNERYYAEGIKHGNWKGEVRKDREGHSIVTTKDVYGNEIETNESLANMRKDIENFLQSHPDLNVINTTKGGAEIKGAPFEKIEDVINKYLTEKVVAKEWFENSDKNITNITIKQVRILERELEKMYGLYDSCMRILGKLNDLKTSSNLQQINKLVKDFYKNFNQILKNRFYISFILPIIKNDFEQVNNIIRTTKEELNLVKKVETINLVYSNYLYMVQEIFNELLVYIKEFVHPEIVPLKEDASFYSFNDGALHYEGNWSFETIAFSDYEKNDKKFVIRRTISKMSSERGSKIKFYFKGTMLQVYTQTGFDFSNNIRITIDGVEKYIKTKENKYRFQLSPKYYQRVFEIKSLKNELHEVCIELLTDEPFHFQGISINKGGRVYHIDEVKTVNDIKIGKRIRCNVKKVDELGFSQISSLGEVVVPSMDIDKTGIESDFYVEIVSKLSDDQYIAVANRNIGITKLKYENIEFILNKIPILQSNRSNIVEISCSSFHQTEKDTWDVYKAFNKKLESDKNAWASLKGVTNGWIKFKFSNPMNISCIAITAQPEFNHKTLNYRRSPLHWLFEAKENDQWITLFEDTNSNNWLGNVKNIYKFKNDKYYTEYKITIVKNNGDPNFVSIGEIELI